LPKDIKALHRYSEKTKLDDVVTSDASAAAAAATFGAISLLWSLLVAVGISALD